MSIHEIIKQLSEDIEIECYYIKRPADNKNCIVYTYTEVPNLIGDMKELRTKYIVLFNVYCESNVEKTKTLVKEALQYNGFKKKIIPGTVLEANNIYNTAMQYTISLKN